MPPGVAEASPPASVQVSVVGGGTVAPGGSLYPVGTLLTFTAQPAVGFAFSEWTDTAGRPLAPGSYGLEFEYMVTGDAQIVARFAPSPFAEAAGTWTACLRTFDFDAAGNPHATAHGVAAITLAGSGAFTGTLSFDAEDFVLSGTFDAAGRASRSFPRAGRKPLRAELRVKLDAPTDQFSIAVYDGDECAMASVSRRAPTGVGGRCTLAIESMVGGKGYASLMQMPSGMFEGAGSLADGSLFSFATQPARDHFAGAITLPLNARLGGGALLSGQVLLQNAAFPAADFSAKLQWITPVLGNVPPPTPGPRVFVGTLGADTNAGTVDFPLATLDAALAHLGGTGEIVMLPGDYERASVNLATAGKVTLRSAPGHTARIFFGEKIAGSAFIHHQGNVWKTAVQSSVPEQGTENRYWVFEIGTPEGMIASGAEFPQQRLRTARLDHFRLVQASSIENVDTANGRYFIAGNMLYLRTSGGEPPRPDQEFRIPSQVPTDSVVFGAGPQCEITLRGIEVYFASNGGDVRTAASFVASECKFFGSGNSGILTIGVRSTIEQRCEYAANANDGSSPVGNGSPPSHVTVIDPWSHDNGDEGHSLHVQCRGFYFGGLYELNANGGITPALGANTVILGTFTRGNLVGINPAVFPPVNMLVADWTSVGDFDGLANWTSGLVTVVDSRVLNPLRYSFNGVAADSRIAVLSTTLQGGIGHAAGAGGPNITFGDAPLVMPGKDTAQATPVSLRGSRFEVPGANQRVTPFGSRPANGQIVVRESGSAGLPAVRLAESFTLDAANQASVTGLNPQQLAIQIDAQTGQFTGTFNDRFQPTLTRSFTGVIFQSQHHGMGFSQSAEVVISIPYDASYGPPTAPAFTMNKPAPAGNARFGQSIAISASRMVVGACQAESGAGGAGNAFLYDLKGVTPAVPIAVLNNPDPVSGGKFGISVAISGTRMVVGSPVDGPGSPGGGKVYVYDLSGPNPVLVTTLANPNPAANGFGSTVAISGVWIVVGAPVDDTGAMGGGKAYLFSLLGTIPTLMATLNNPSPAANDRFGSAVAMAGTRIVVGACLDDTGATDAGSVYVYNVIGATPQLPIATINNPTPAESDRFGFSVAIFALRVVVGAIGDDTRATDAGSAYVYALGGSTSSLPIFTLNKPNPSAGDRFGYSVAASSARVVVGACHDDTGASDTGRAYVYELFGATLTAPTTTLNNPIPGYFDNFGGSVAADGTNVAVGLPFDATIAQEKGAVYVFTYPPGQSITVPSGTNIVADGGRFDSIVIDGGGKLTVDGPPPTTGAVGVPSVRLSGIGMARRLTVEFIRSKNAGLTYAVEFSDTPDGASFQPAVNTPIITPIDQDLEHVVVADHVTIGNQPLRFGRVKVTSP